MENSFKKIQSRFSNIHKPFATQECEEITEAYLNETFHSWPIVATVTVKESLLDISDPTQKVRFCELFFENR